ncbi:hypothetical protein GCM10027402_17370 [Arthrobacter monumenti]
MTVRRGAPALQCTDYDAVVSLSRVGTAETHVPDKDRASFWLMEEVRKVLPNAGPNERFVRALAQRSSHGHA